MSSKSNLVHKLRKVVLQYALVQLKRQVQKHWNSITKHGIALYISGWALTLTKDSTNHQPHNLDKTHLLTNTFGLTTEQAKDSLYCLENQEAMRALRKLVHEKEKYNDK